MNRLGESQLEIYRLARSATLDAIEALGPHREVMDVRSLSSTDRRSFHTKVAGPAALLVAKAHKIQERLGVKSRERSKDAYDVYRLLRGFKTTILAERPGADRDGARPRETTPANRPRGSYRTPENVGLEEETRPRRAHATSAAPTFNPPKRGSPEGLSDAGQRYAATRAPALRACVCPAPSCEVCGH